MRERKILSFRPEDCLEGYGCRICAKACPLSALDFVGGRLQYCKNCGKSAPCILACRRFALEYDEGIVSVNSNCNACGECVDACRYGGLRISGKRAVKCDMCRCICSSPVCAGLCPTGALEAWSAVEPDAASGIGLGSEALPEVRFLGDEGRLSASQWADVSANYRPRHARLFFRVLGLPQGEKRLLKKYGRVSIYEIGREKVYYYDFSGINYEDARLADEVKARVIEDCRHGISAISGRDARVRAAEQMACEVVRGLSPGIDAEKAGSIARLVSRDIGGYSFVEFLLEDRASIENIEHLRSGEPVHVVLKDKDIGNCKTNFLISDECAFRSIVNKLAEGSGKSISEANPRLDFFIGGSDRVMALSRPYSTFGGSFSIRVSQAQDPWTLPMLVREGALSPECAAYLWLLEGTRLGGVITGPPGCGKTSLLNAMIQCTPPGLVVRTIEEGTRELDASRRSWSSFVGRSIDEKELSGKRRGESSVLTGEDLLSASLRFYTDRLYVGEIRGPEARYFTTALNLGISAVKTTMHSHETGASVLSRLRAQPMCVDDNNLPYIRVFVHLSKCPDGARRVVSVGEIKWNVWGDLPDVCLAGLEGSGSVWRSGNNVALIESVFYWDSRSERFRSGLGNSIVLKAYAREHGLSVKEAGDELGRRAALIRHLCRKGIVRHGPVCRVFEEYHLAKGMSLEEFVKKACGAEDGPA